MENYSAEREKMAIVEKPESVASSAEQLNFSELVSELKTGDKSKVIFTYRDIPLELEVRRRDSDHSDKNSDVIFYFF